MLLVYSLQLVAIVFVGYFVHSSLCTDKIEHNSILNKSVVGVPVLGLASTGQRAQSYPAGSAGAMIGHLTAYSHSGYNPQVFPDIF